MICPLTYKQLLEVKRGSARLQEVARGRPVYHHRKDRIRGHAQWADVLHKY